ncbi:MAG TPA: gamma-glutamyl-gamma-aminobutyrate hydrolase family protein [Thermoanaerobacterales bacterium]|nr:gamma-glutamyl-gamma-aminobutyrate hydrolase family protein [Thermoanaerobacterales bacterium]
MYPLIGITTSYDSENKKASLNRGYFRAVQQAGGIPVPVLPLDDKKVLLRLLERLDGIIFSGGPDVDPSYFNEEPHPRTGDICPERDEAEVFLARESMRLSKPMLGICRGIQLINIALGGSIYQDIDSQIKKPLKHRQDAPHWHASHEVEITCENSWLSEIFGTDRIRVNSFHHQSVKDIAPDLRVTAAARDGVIEAVEAKDRGIFCVGVQWHPEEMWYKDPLQFRLFEHFIKVCLKN